MQVLTTRGPTLFLGLLWLSVGASAVIAQDDKPNAAAVEFFEKKIRPVLATRCYECHSGSSIAAEGGLVIDSREGLVEGGDHGAVIVPGKPDESTLIKAVRQDGKLKMPPKAKLSDQEVADLVEWVKMGAPDPRDRSDFGSQKSSAVDFEKARDFWSFKLPVKADAPTLQNPRWPKTPIDAFVLKKLEENGLTPVDDADPVTLIRRVTFDLIGLPPTPEEIAAFVADPSPNAYDAVVDRLLQSPHFGERWGRHWLDVARFAESSGKEQNIVYPWAWRYRDYVIESFNEDKPFDRFLREQIAGDLLPAKTEVEKAENLVATGFLAIGPKSHNERNPQQFRVDLADEQIDAMSQAMLGLTISCARCHDHKFDPIPTRDYHALLGIFTSTDTRFGTAGRGVGRRNGGDLLELPRVDTVPNVAVLTPEEIAARRKAVEELRAERDRIVAEARESGKRPNDISPRFLQISQRLAQAEQQLSYFDADGNPVRFGMGVVDAERPADSPIFVRGELDNRGPRVERGFLTVLAKGEVTPIRKGSGRLELAAWVAGADNPLTARVMANRIWRHLFGRGIVLSTDNFGATGDAPVNQPLLDYLAVRLVDNGWSVKTLIRDVVRSRVYRLASTFDPKNFEIDPDNAFVWRSGGRRLDAESIRDAMLFVSGELDRTPPVGSPVMKLEGNAAILERQAGRRGNRGQRAPDPMIRSIYLPVIRDQVVEALAVFDFAEPSLVIGDRNETVVPAQALFLMNDPWVMRRAEGFAKRLLADPRFEGIGRLKRAFQLAYGRDPTDTEKVAAQTFFEKFAAAEKSKPKRGEDPKTLAWTAFCQALLGAADFRYLN